MTLSRPHAVLFDLDGVLIETRSLWLAVMNATARELGCPAIPRVDFDRSWGQSLERDVADFYPGHRGDEVAACYERHWDGHFDALDVKPAGASLLEQLTRIGTRTAVVTNTPGHLARRLLEHARLRPEVVVGGDEVPRPKPAGDLLLAACRAIGVDCRQAWMVGDTGCDRDAAAATGAAFIGFGVDGDARIGSLDDLWTLVVAASS